MALKFYNTLTKKKEEFKPLRDKEVGLYTCGPTVYDYAHIGNFRTYVFQDILKRYLEYKGYKVKHVMNITDVDDKTIKRSQEQGIPLKEYTEKYTKAFFEDMKTLNIESADVYPRATETIKEMVELVKKLLEKGLAYKSDDGIYYDISKFKDYGKLSGFKIEELKAGARVKKDEYSKENAYDFALWKFWKPEDGDVYWETEIGKGRPGWHIECSTMSMKYLGETFDIHTGGVDLIFPHHENEIAQSEGATGKPFVRYWLHAEHLLVNGKKMSKSLGNFYTLRDLLSKGYEPVAIRYVLLSTHYQQKLNFTFKSLEAAKNTVQRIFEFVDRVREAKGKDTDISDILQEAKNEFEEAMDDNLEISRALASMFEFIKKVNQLIDSGKIGDNNKKGILGLIQEFDKVLGILDMRKPEVDKDLIGKVSKIAEEYNLKSSNNFEKLMSSIIRFRESARAKKDYQTSDTIRTKLLEIGVELQDTDKGVKWKIKI